MDIIESCKAILKAASAEDNSELECRGSQSFADGSLDKILNQQSHLKRIIDQDNEIQLVKATLTRVALEIEDLRRLCTKENEDALTKRHELVATQAKEVSLALREQEFRPKLGRSKRNVFI